MEEAGRIKYCIPEVVDFRWMGVLGHCTNGTSAAHAGGSNCSQGSSADSVCNIGNDAYNCAANGNVVSS